VSPPVEGGGDPPHSVNVNKTTITMESDESDVTQIDTPSRATLSSIFVYPIKSCGAVQVVNIESSLV